MSINDISNETSLRTAAVIYLTQGFSVIPLTGKKAQIPWRVYQCQRARTSDLNWWVARHHLNNLGIVCGAISGNLVVLDLDGEWGINTVSDLFPNLLDTFTVTTGTGMHKYFYVDDLPTSARHARGAHSGVELRSNGAYVVAPPSIHPETHKPYWISAQRPIKRLPALGWFKTWIEGLNAQNQPPAPPIERGLRTMRFGGKGRINNPRAYTQSAVQKELRAVQTTTEGARNDQLNISAYNLGQLVGMGWLASYDAERLLLDAALSAGLSQAEALPTIQSGLQKGISEPRDTQWEKRK